MGELNVFGDEWDGQNERPGWQTRNLGVGRRLGAERIGATVYEIAPGQRNFPYHYHLALEELVVVLAGTPTLRQPSGERTLQPGDAVLFPRGEAGGHQLRNDTDQPARVLMVSSKADVEAVVYPDSDKLGVAGVAADGTKVRLITRPESAVDYWDGEG
jgi:uncharacterized cupin superfamily protein